MPIRAGERHKYPLNWTRISLRVRQEAGWCCQQCGIRQGTPLVGGHRVILSTAHILNPDPSDCRPENL